MPITSIVVSVTEIIGTVAFALSGALTGIQKKLDLFGVLFLGMLTSLGGGTIRDLLLGITPPRMFYNFRFLLIASLTSFVLFWVAYGLHCRGNTLEGFETKLNAVNNIFDALGLAAFSLTGVQAAMEAGYTDNLFLCVFMGVTTGIGGGILRDLTVRDTPAVFRKRIYAIASMAGCLCYCLLCLTSLPAPFALLLSMLLIFVIRLLATHYRWSLPRIG